MIFSTRNESEKKIIKRSYQIIYAIDNIMISYETEQINHNSPLFPFVLFRISKVSQFEI